MNRLQISLLGPMRVAVDGEPVAHFRTVTAQALLAYLAMHAGASHRREHLAALLWPDRPESVALQNLRQTLRVLRVAIGDAEAAQPFLEVTRTTIALCPGDEPVLGSEQAGLAPAGERSLWLDVSAFVEAIAASERHAHRRVESCASCMERLGEAAALYQGEFLAGFSLPSALFEQWMVVEREHLHGQALEVLAHLAAHHEGRGEYDKAAGYARRQVELEPWREEAHRQWMRALALSGQRGAALAQYEACRQILAAELGVEPEAETQALYERIRDGEELRPAVAALLHNLPAQMTPFVGRESLLAEIAAHLDDPGCRLLTLVGPGGSGKTRLAVEAAFREAGNYAHGVFFVSLAPLQSVASIVPTVAQALGLSLRGPQDPRRQLLDYLRQKAMLLVLDNFEHLLDGVDILADILRAAPASKALVTSRVALNARGEQLLPVPGMRYPEQLPATLDAALDYSALQLFLGGARRARPGYQPTAEDLAALVEVCRRVQGIPLALLLAAAWMRLLSPAEIAAQVGEQGLDFLEADWRDAPARQRSMRAVFDHSWRLLGEREREVFAGLSVFRGGFTREAALQVAGASLRDLAVLVDRSLLDRTPAGRFETHELLRQYAAERLCLASTVATPQRDESVEATPGRPCVNVPGRQCVAGGERHCAAVRDRHCAYYLAALARWEGDLKSARQQTALAEMDVEIDNVRAAWAWATEQRRIADLARAAEGMSLYCELRSLHTEGPAMFQAAADAIQQMCGPGKARSVDGMSVDELRVLARMRMWQSVSSALPQGQQIEVASRSVLQGLELLDRPELADCDTRLERGILLYMLARSRFEVQREETRQQSERSLALLRAIDDRWWAGRVLTYLGILAWDLGDYGSAREYLAESLAAFRAQGDPRRSAEALAYASLVDSWQGHVERAEQLARESLALIQTTGVRDGIAGATEVVAQAVRQAGKFVEAEALMERCLVIWNDLGTRLTATVQVLGRAKMHLGQYARARALAREELALFRHRGLRRAVGIYLGLLGMAALPAGEYEDAYSWLQEALDIFHSFAMRGEQARTEPVAGLAAQRMGQPDRAREHLVEALRLGRELDSWPPVALALPAIALLLADRGQIERAVELYALASRYPYVANSRWFEDVAGREISALTATLPPEVVAAAQARGRARDLWATAEELLAELGG